MPMTIPPATMPAYTWATRPASAVPGTIIRVTDIGGGTLWVYGTRWRPLNGCAVLAIGSDPVSVTGTLVETTLASLVIPAGLIGPVGSLRITTRQTHTNNGNSKTQRVKLDGTAFLTMATTATRLVRSQLEITNRSAENVQIGCTTNTSVPGLGFSSAAAYPSGTIDTTAQTLLTITAQLANIADTVTLETYVVELIA